MARKKRYKVGDQVVYPQHGVATIQKIEDKNVLGEKQSYLVLELDEGDLTLMVPAASVEEVGIRNVVSHTDWHTIPIRPQAAPARAQNTGERSARRFDAAVRAAIASTVAAAIPIAAPPSARSCRSSLCA